MQIKQWLCLITLSLNLLFLTTKAWALEQSPPRLISLAPHLTEMVYDLELQQQLVAVDAYSNYPAAAKKLPRIGSGLEPNQELLLRYGADILLSYSSSVSIEKIARKLGMRLWISQPQSVPALFADWRQLLALAQTDPQKAALIEDKIQQLEMAWREMTATYASRQGKSVFFLIAEQPLYSISDQSFLSAALKGCQAENIFADIKQSSFLVDPEALLVKRPEFIIHGYRSDQANGKQLAQAAVLARLQKLGLTVQAEQLISVDVDILHRPSLRFIHTLPSICAALHKATH
ncbi:Vitamin B12-binding protein precursor [Oligella urethralis]|uniref:ABC transporter substrate-binding protein n=1 Tax=Oligella urethralis TaxID=90245 RepID=UPI00035D06E0|nr:ABC transporter substrate-binding protein [Oligella urethralis]SUA62458.1 Vitamin B12-binding protein precursor [Oligella urethralis]SUA68703.1 Vitamin B12-binding protein precursor [Oligella urethralis]